MTIKQLKQEIIEEFRKLPQSEMTTESFLLSTIDRIAEETMQAVRLEEVTKVEGQYSPVSMGFNLAVSGQEEKYKKFIQEI